MQSVIQSMRSHRIAAIAKHMTFTYCYQEIRKNLGAMYDPIVGQYVLDHWEWVTKGQKK